MQYIIPPTDIRKYSQNGYVEFGFMYDEDNIVSLEQELIPYAKEKRDDFHLNDTFKKLTHSKHIIKIASELTQRNPIKYILSRVYTGHDLCKLIPDEETTLENLMHFQHTLVAFIACVKGKQENSPFIPSMPGNVTCINTKRLFSLKESDIEKDSLYVVTVFGEKNTRYFYNSNDTFGRESRLEGFSNGDSLHSDDYPLYYTQ